MKEKKSPSVERYFKGVWIPAWIWLHPSLTWMEKIVFAEINSLTDPERGCTASNEFLARHFNLTRRHTIRLISKLQKMKLVKSALINFKARSGNMMTLRTLRAAAFQDDLSPRGGVTRMSPPQGHGCHGGGDTDVTPYSPRERTRDSAPPSALANSGGAVERSGHPPTSSAYWREYLKDNPKNGFAKDFAEMLEREERKKAAKK